MRYGAKMGEASLSALLRNTHRMPSKPGTWTLSSLARCEESRRMLKNDYILKMIMDMGTTIRKVIGLPEIDRKDHFDDIEKAVGDAVNIDPALFFSLDPDSAASLMSVGDVDQKLARYVSHAILLESRMLEVEGDMSRARLRHDQALAVANMFDCDLPGSDAPIERIVAVFPEEADADGAASAADSDMGGVGSDGEGDGIIDEREELQRRYAGSGISIDSLKMDL